MGFWESISDLFNTSANNMSLSDMMTTPSPSWPSFDDGGFGQLEMDQSGSYVPETYIPSVNFDGLSDTELEMQHSGSYVPADGGSSSSSGSGMGGFFGNLGKDFLRSAAPLAGQLAVAGIADKLFPGKTRPTEIVKTDTRTAEGTAGEKAKLDALNALPGQQAAAKQPMQDLLTKMQTTPGYGVLQNPRQIEAETGRLNAFNMVRDEIVKAMSDPYYGTATPEVQAQQLKDVKRDRRTADAARGMLETGGSANREAADILRYKSDRSKERLDTINRRFGDLNSLSTGFQGPIDQNNVMAGLASNMGQIDQGFGALRNNLLTGFQPGFISQIPGESQPNPWAALLTSALAPKAGAGIEALMKRYV